MNQMVFCTYSTKWNLTRDFSWYSSRIVVFVSFVHDLFAIKCFQCYRLTYTVCPIVKSSYIVFFYFLNCNILKSVSLYAKHALIWDVTSCKSKLHKHKKCLFNISVIRFILGLAYLYRNLTYKKKLSRKKYKFRPKVPAIFL
jgi:hypothetical protein